MKIEVILNTCDVAGLEQYGEIMVSLKDGKPVGHHDDSDGALGLDYVARFLSPFVEVEFVEIEPTKKQVKLVSAYLKDIYGEM